jgi:hypothetical protein
VLAERLMRQPEHATGQPGCGDGSYPTAVTDDARRRAALATMTERFPAVAERVRSVYGLRLPRHLAVFCALWHGADAAERAALDHLMVAPGGVADYFADGGLDLTGRDGLDERLHDRFRRDPAEFVTVLMGGSDGLHYGLWYDDPAELPSFIVHNWARDSAETWTDRRPTLLDELRHRVGRALTDYGGDPETSAAMQPLTAALDWYAEADRAAREADGEPRWASAPRYYGEISVFPALPPGAGDAGLGIGARLRAFRRRDPKAEKYIARAERELAAGKPAYALNVGAELHWLDADEYREQSRDLLVGAYRALGRDALADIVEVHVANRDLRSVDVLTRS